MTEFTRQDAIERIEGVLKSVGIKMNLWSPDADLEVEFPDGAKVRTFNRTLSIVCDGISYQRS